MEGTQLSAGKQAYVEQVVRLARADADRPATVLEAGVGVGISALAVAKSLSPPDSFSAIDRDAENIARLRTRLRTSVVCRVTRLVVGDIAAMEAFEDASFDVVGSDTVVAMLGVELHRPFAELFRVLRPGGALVVRELLPPRPDGDTRRDLFMRVVLAARALVGDQYAMLPVELVAGVLRDVGFAPPTHRSINETDGQPDLTQWYPLSSPEFPLRQALLEYYADRSVECTDSGGSVTDSYLLVARRPG